MPHIWMTYAEIAGLLSCDIEEARAQAIDRSLDRMKGRDGLTRVRLDPHWTARFLAALRESDPSLDQAISDLLRVGREMARHPRPLVRGQPSAHEARPPIRRRA